PSYVVGVHTSQAFAACYLGSAFRKAVDGRIAGRNLHELCVGVIREATNEASLCRQGELYIALSECLFHLFALGHIDVDADQAFRVAGLVILYKTATLDPPDRSAGTQNPKLRVMLAAPLGICALAARQKRRQVFGMD